jgi:hypothetical protein
VDIALEDFRAGPLEVSSFSLARAGEAPYSMRMSATSSPASLVGFGAERLGISAAPLLGFVAEQTDADRRFPIELDVELVSEEGRIDVVSGSGTVAGFPTGPLAEIITAAVVGSL